MLKKIWCVDEIHNKNCQSFLFAMKNDKNNFSSILFIKNRMIKRLIDYLVTERRIEYIQYEVR